MATVVNNPPPSGDSNSTSTLLVLLFLALLAFLFFYYGLPALRSATSGPQINVPPKVDVNLNQPNSQGGQQNP